MRLLSIVGKFVLYVAAAVFIVSAFLFVTGAYLASWPIMRVSPQYRRMQSALGLVVALAAVGRAYGLDKQRDTDATEATEESRKGVM